MSTAHEIFSSDDYPLSTARSIVVRFLGLDTVLDATENGPIGERFGRHVERKAGSYRAATHGILLLIHPTALQREVSIPWMDDTRVYRLGDLILVRQDWNGLTMSATRPILVQILNTDNGLRRATAMPSMRLVQIYLPCTFNRIRWATRLRKIVAVQHQQRFDIETALLPSSTVRILLHELLHFVDDTILDISVLSGHLSRWSQHG